MNNTILIVEDSKTYNFTLKDNLEPFGFEIFQAYSLKQATKILQEEKIEYVILDLNLPDGDGDDLLEVINLQDEKLKIMVLSASSDIQKRNYLFENGVVEYFSKDTKIPILINEIVELIKDLSENKNKNILIVDDSNFVRKSLTRILLSKNYNIFEAKDPIIALQMLQEQEVNIDLIFLDLEMPKMNGDEFLDIVKKDSSLSQIPILVLSGSIDRVKYANVLRHGALDFIKKPFFAEEILLKTDLHIKQSDYIKKIKIQSQELHEYKRALDLSDIISKTDTKGKITYVNKKFCEISGYAEYELLGHAHNIVRHPDVPSSVYENMWKKLKNKEVFTGIVKNKKKDGTPYYVDATIVPLLDINGDIKEYIGIRHDISEVMNPKKQLMADILHSQNPILIFLKIGNYSLFRDFYSESIMHEFENQFEKSIIDYFPKYSGIKKVYNLSNGLFAFLKNETKKANEIEKCLNEVLSNFKNQGVVFQGNKFDVDIYMSFSLDKNNIFDDVSLGIDDAIKRKENIIFAKNYYEKSQIEAKNNLKNIQLIKDAFANEGKFILHFQPIIDNKTSEIAKYEGLIRLVTKDGDVISPFHFLPVSKKTGYYNLITEVVIDKCYEVLSQTDKAITINLSAADIENLNIRNKLLNLIGRAENRGRITYELLEDESVKDMKTVKDFISLSKVIGDVKIAIDDFGSGYSNYERLLEFQPDILKIDGSLIKNIENDEFSKSVVESIIVFAKKQNIKTVAEFVSNENIYNIVTQMGIDFSQGYHLGTPAELI